MCDGIGQKDLHAILINLSGTPEHRENIEMGLDLLTSHGYETWVASPEKPSQPVDHYIEATPEMTWDSIAELVGELNDEIDSNDELVIYTTGHGNFSSGILKLCSDTTCSPHYMGDLLDGIEYGRRIVVMPQCYGGSWGEIFLDDPNTLFISAGSPGETVSPGFPDHIWSSDFSDSNPGIDWQGRFELARESGILFSIPQFIPSPGFVGAGPPPFDAEALPVASGKNLKIALENLEPGQYAAILFADGSDQDYELDFEEQAELGGGQHLYIETDNPKIAKAYGIDQLPAIVIVSSNGFTNLLPEGLTVEEGIAGFHLTPEEIALEEIAIVEGISDPEEHAFSLIILAQRFGKRDFDGSTVTVFDALFDAVEEIEDVELRADTIGTICSHISESRLPNDEKVVVLEMLKGVASRSGDKSVYARTLRTISHDLAKAGFEAEALSTFEEAVDVACSIKNAEDQAFELKVLVANTDYSIFGKNTSDMIDLSTEAAKSIKKPALRARTLAVMALYLALDGFEDEAITAFEESIGIADGIKNKKLRTKIQDKISEFISKAGLEDQIELSLS